MHSRRSRYTILLHLEDTVKQGYDKIAIRTVDTDVVDLAVTSAQCLNITQLWIAFGARTNIRYLPAHEMANALGLDRCVTFPMFHAFIDCDTMSCFGSKGNRTAWDIRSAYDEVTPAFCALAASPETVDHWLCPPERLLVLLYDCTSVRNLSMELGSSQHKKVELLSSDTSSIYPAHKAGCSSSRSLLGTYDDREFGASISK